MITSASDKLFGLETSSPTIPPSMGLLSMSVSHFGVMDLKSGRQFGIKHKCREWDSLMKAIACYVEGCYNVFTVVARNRSFLYAYLHFLCMVSMQMLF